MDPTVTDQLAAGSTKLHAGEPSLPPKPDGQIVVGDIPAQRPGFQPRPALLKLLSQPRAGSQAVVLRGAQGAGKTQLAAAYARARMAGGWRLIAWVSARDSESLLAGLAGVAEAAGLSDGGSQRDPADPGQAVRRWLEADGSQCLLVFDDVVDPDLLEPFVPAAGAARVLISTAGEAIAGLEETVQVNVFSAGEAQALLVGRTGLADEVGASAVAAELGYLPLALDQAAAVIAGQCLGYAAYLAKLQALTAGDHLVPGGNRDEQPYPPGAAEAVLLSLEAARAADPIGVCGAVMEIMAVLSPAVVRRDLLRAAGQSGTLLGRGRRVAAAMVDQALERLSEWSLLGSSLDGRGVTVHYLVARVVRDGLARQERRAAACEMAAAALEASADALGKPPDHAAVTELAGQVTALLANAQAPAADADEKLTSTLVRLLGTNHPKTVASRHKLALARQEAEQAAGPVGEAGAPPDPVPGPPAALADEEPPPAPPVAERDDPSPTPEPKPEPGISKDVAEPEPSTAGVAEPPAPSRDRLDRRWRRIPSLVAAIVVLLAAGGMAVALSRPHAGHSGHGSMTASRPAGGQPGSETSQLAATWVAQQVTRSAIVACDPLMCSALEAQGMPAANLLVLRTGTMSPLWAEVVVVTPAVRSRFGSRLDSVYAPSVIASFGSGADQVTVQVIARNGRAAYLTALREDVAARKAAGAQLLANKRIRVSAEAAAQLGEGAVDSRLLIMLPALAAVHQIQILAFGQPAPGAGPGVPLCSADLSGSGRAAAMTDASYLNWLTSFVRAQLGAFRGSMAVLQQAGQPVMRVVFAQPSPLGLLAHA